MSPDGRKITGFLVLAVVAVPFGLLSMALMAEAMRSFWTKDALERAINPSFAEMEKLAFVGSLIGWVICGLSAWIAIRLARAAGPEDSTRESKT